MHSVTSYIPEATDPAGALNLNNLWSDHNLLQNECCNRINAMNYSTCDPVVCFNFETCSRSYF